MTGNGMTPPMPINTGEQERLDKASEIAMQQLQSQLGGMAIELANLRGQLAVAKEYTVELQNKCNALMGEIAALKKPPRDPASVSRPTIGEAH